MNNYLWVMETLDDDGEVVEVEEHAELAVLMDGYREPADRNVFLVAAGPATFGVAWVSEGELEAEFDDGMGEVPERFHRELANYLKGAV